MECDCCVTHLCTSHLLSLHYSLSPTYSGWGDGSNDFLPGCPFWPSPSQWHWFPRLRNPRLPPAWSGGAATTRGTVAAGRDRCCGCGRCRYNGLGSSADLRLRIVPYSGRRRVWRCRTRPGQGDAGRRLWSGPIRKCADISVMQIILWLWQINVKVTMWTCHLSYSYIYLLMTLALLVTFDTMRGLNLWQTHAYNDKHCALKFTSLWDGHNVMTQTSWWHTCHTDTSLLALSGQRQYLQHCNRCIDAIQHHRGQAAIRVLFSPYNPISFIFCYLCTINASRLVFGCHTDWFRAWTCSRLSFHTHTHSIIDRL